MLFVFTLTSGRRRIAILWPAVATLLGAAGASRMAVDIYAE